MTPQSLHRQLLDPAAYPEPTTRVEFEETHISLVYLTDSHAYKIKKPLQLGFLDYSTLERREFYCAEEVRLNRRFAPGTYLGVARLCNAGGVLRFDGTGTVVEVAVRMRRLPRERMLDRLLDAGDPELPSEIERLARHLPQLLATSPVCRDEGHVAAVRANCLENLAQSEFAVGGALAAEAHSTMAGLTERHLAGLARLMAEREARGWVRDGHGDLHTRNICMTESIQVYDCIEFSRRLRVADIAAELAFLLMDLDYRGHRNLAGLFLDLYLAHAADPDLAALLPFYKSYRAWVRGKVDALLASEADAATSTRQLALKRSSRYFSLALGYHVHPTLLLTCGLMGVGKSTLAGALAAALGGEWLRSDVLRKELAGLPTDRPCPESFGKGLYAPEMTALTYAELRKRAERTLQTGQTVIIDASFARSADRSEFYRLAETLHRPVRLLYLRCAPEIALDRLDRRQQAGTDASDGRREVAAAQAAEFEVPSAGERPIAVDSSASVDYNVQTVICRLLSEYPS